MSVWHRPDTILDNCQGLSLLASCFWETPPPVRIWLVSKSHRAGTGCRLQSHASFLTHHLSGRSTTPSALIATLPSLLMELFEGHHVQLCRFAFDLAVLSPDASADCVRYEFLVLSSNRPFLHNLFLSLLYADSCAQIGSHVRTPSVMASSTPTTAWSTSTTEALSMSWPMPSIQLAGLDQWFFPIPSRTS